MLKAIVPKAWHELKKSDRDKLTEWAKSVGLEVAETQLEKEMRVAFDSYIKMVCVVLHDAMGMDEGDLTVFLGNHKRLFARQVRLVREDAQREYLNNRMKEIFPESGFPQEFFDKMFGDGEK